MPRRLILSIACVAALLTAAPRASLYSQQKMDLVNLSRAQGMLRDALPKREEVLLRPQIPRRGY